jgi:threonine dehydrogenase-like Zn-dependent dehydrogenase
LPQEKLHKSNALSLDQLALVEPLSIGAHAVNRAGLEPGEFVLVVGAGPIGLAVIQFALLAGARVIVMDVNDDRLSFATQHFNLERAIKVGDGTLDELRSATSDDLPTAVFDATGNARSMADSFNLVAHGGRLIFVGLFQGNLTFSDPDAHRRELTVLCSRNSTGEDFRRIIGQLERRELGTNTDWITHRVGFHQVVDEFPHWLEPESKFVKALIEV